MHGFMFIRSNCMECDCIDNFPCALEPTKIQKAKIKIVNVSSYPEDGSKQITRIIKCNGKLLMNIDEKK